MPHASRLRRSQNGRLPAGWSSIQQARRPPTQGYRVHVALGCQNYRCAMGGCVACDACPVAFAVVDGASAVAARGAVCVLVYMRIRERAGVSPSKPGYRCPSRQARNEADLVRRDAPGCSKSDTKTTACRCSHRTLFRMLTKSRFLWFSHAWTSGFAGDANGAAA